MTFRVNNLTKCCPIAQVSVLSDVLASGSFNDREEVDEYQVEYCSIKTFKFLGILSMMLSDR